MTTGSRVRSFVTVASGILAGRITGLMRDLTLAALLGASALADAANLVLTLPDILTGLLVGGAMSAVLVPEFQRINESERRRLFWWSSFSSALVFSLLAIGLSLNSGTLLSLMAPGLSPDVYELARHAFSITLLALPFSVLAAVTTAYLQVQDRFAPSAVGTVIINVCVIAALFVGRGSGSALMVLSVGIIAGGVLRWLVQLTAAAVPISKSHFARRSPNLQLARRYVEALGGGGILLFLPVLGRSFASLDAVGSVAIFNYGLKLVEFPLGVALTVFSTVLFPSFASAFADSSRADHARAMSRQVYKLVYLFALACAVVSIGIGVSLAASPARLGSLEASSVRQVGLISIWLLLALLPRALSSIHIMIFNSHRDTFRPLLINLTAVLLLFAVLRGFAIHETREVAALISLTYWLIYACELVLIQRRFGIRLASVFLKPDLWAGTAVLLVSLAAMAILLTRLPLSLSVNVVIVLIVGGVGAAGAAAVSPDIRNVLRQRIGRRR